MTASIPASQLVSVIPGVLGAGGNPLALNSVFLTSDGAVPIGTVQPFSTLADVQSFFGASSAEARMAGIYFSGFEGCTKLPGLLYFYQANSANVAAYVRGGSQAGVALTALQALGTGTVIVTADGIAITSAAINLSGATSFSNAAALIQTGIRAGSPGNTLTCTYDTQRAAFVVGSSTTGAASTMTFATGTLSVGLKLTSATGAVLSQGAIAYVPATAMAQIVSLTQNWALFTTTFEPNGATKLLFANWVTTTNDRYVYIAWDSDLSPTTSPSAAASFGALTATFDGVVPVFDLQLGNIAAFICGAVAATNYGQTNGRITLAYKAQAGLSADVTDATVATNLISNGYNFYGSYATANQSFTFLQDGQISGDWLWIDPYVNQIYLNSQLQLAFMSLLSQVNSVPYNQQGYGLLRAAAQDPINEALNNGTIRSGVTLSSSQAAQVNTAAGAKISDVLQNTGWYLQVLDPGAIVRAARGTPSMTLWYTDGGSVQKINLASIDVL